MKFKNMMLVALMLFAVLTIGAAGASEDFTQDNLTVQMDNPDIPEMAVEDDGPELSASKDEDVLGQLVVEDNQNDAGKSGQPVLSSAIIHDDITLKANTKTIDTTKGNTVLATFKVPKGAKGKVCLDFEESEEFHIELSKLPVKKTKGRFTTYSLRVKDVKGHDLLQELKTGQHLVIFLRYNDKNDEPNTFYGFDYLVKVNKKAKTIKLNLRKQTDVWIGPYDRRSGSNKIMTVHLETWQGKHPLAHKKVKITINGVVYVKKTNSKVPSKAFASKAIFEGAHGICG